MIRYATIRHDMMIHVTIISEHGRHTSYVCTHMGDSRSIGETGRLLVMCKNCEGTVREGARAWTRVEEGVTSTATSHFMKYTCLLDLASSWSWSYFPSCYAEFQIRNTKVHPPLTWAGERHMPSPQTKSLALVVFDSSKFLFSLGGCPTDKSGLPRLLDS